MTKDMVYMGPLIGWIDPTLRALDDRCAEIAEVAMRDAERPGVWAMMRSAMALAAEDDIIDGFASLALPYYVRDHDPGDED